jgi:hypothetical protein
MFFGFRHEKTFSCVKSYSLTTPPIPQEPSIATHWKTNPKRAPAGPWLKSYRETISPPPFVNA